MHHIIYKTSCVATGKYYIGMHSTDDLDDGYLDSGSLVLKSIQVHGVNNHTREVLESLPSRTDLIKREREIVTAELVLDPLCLNLTVGGEGVPPG